MAKTVAKALLIPASWFFAQAVKIEFIGPDLEEDIDSSSKDWDSVQAFKDREALHVRERDEVEKELLHKQLIKLALAHERDKVVEQAIQVRQDYRAQTQSRANEMKQVRERLEKRMAHLQAESAQWKFSRDSEVYEKRVVEEQDRLLALAVQMRKEAEAQGKENHVPLVQVLNISAVDLIEVLNSAASAVKLENFSRDVEDRSLAWQRKIGIRALLAAEINSHMEELVKGDASREEMAKGMLHIWNLTADLFLDHQHDTELYVRALQEISSPSLKRSLEPLATHIAQPVGIAPGILDVDRLANYTSHVDVCVGADQVSKFAAPVLAQLTRIHTAVSSAAQVIPMMDVFLPDCPETLKPVMQRILNVALMQTILVEETASRLVRRCAPVVRSFHCEKERRRHRRLYKGAVVQMNSVPTTKDESRSGSARANPRAVISAFVGVAIAIVRQ